MTRSREIERRIQLLVTESDQQRQQLIAVTTSARRRILSARDSVLSRISAIAAMRQICGILTRILR